MAEPVKVYELAKELGTDSISLLDKLKGIGIAVKSHMSSLTPEQADNARTSLLPPSKKKTKAKKKTKTKKTDGTKAVRVRRTSATSPEAAAADSPATEIKPAARKIIRRRSASEVTEETPVETAVAASPAVTEPNGLAEGTIGTQTSQETVIVQGTQETPVAAPKMSKPVVSVIVKKKEDPPVPKKPAISFLRVVENDPTRKPKIVSQPSKQAKSTTPGAPKDPNDVNKDAPRRIIKMTKEKLDKMAEEEAAKKRGGPVKDRQTIKPEDVRFADYKKREVVFLPKRKRVPAGKTLKRTQITTPAAHKRVVEMGDLISVQELAASLNIKVNEVLRKLIGMGQPASINQSIDFDTATLLATEYKFETKNIAFKEVEIIEEILDAPETLKQRPPVVTVMGHVDHGKTSLLDAIREANVVDKEAGGITQHIGAYTVIKDGKEITFIDTPGHEAFSVMRARGANVTDVVVLVVAADDGVMPQTREAVSHAKAAGVPIIVAVNKIDKAGANPEKIKQGLSELELLSEDWGGQTMFVEVSATEKTNLDKLLEAILLNAEILELKANPDTFGSGSIVEARLDKGRGPVVTALVKRGTLKVGDPIVAGAATGKVRALLDYTGKIINNVTPGIAAEILGFDSVPEAGEKFDCVKDEASAQKLARHREDEIRASKNVANKGRMSLDELFAGVRTGNLKELNVVLKADVFGSSEAVRDSLEKISNDQVKVKVIHTGTGGVTESDILLASASRALIIGFNVRPETKARQLAEKEGIEINCYTIIYELIDEVKKAMTGLLDKKKVEKFLGRAEVRQTFSVPKIGTIAGTSVIDGKILRGASVRLLRDSKILFDGKMSSLKRFKDDAKEVAQGYECGIGLENYNDLKPGDIIEAYQIDLVNQELNS